MDLSLNRLKNKLKRIYLQPALKDAELIIHIGQHKSMTSFFNQVLYNLCVDFNWEYYKFNNLKEFEAGWDKSKRLQKTTIICCYNFYPNLDIFKSFKFVGSNIIRDPRDLLISGYKYHLWTNEEWCCVPMVPEIIERIKINEVEPSLTNEMIKNLSFKELLNQLEEEKGYLAEINFRDKHFKQLEQWNYTLENFIELKYESIFNHEIDWFKKIFTHYGFNEKMTKHGLALVEKNSFKSLDKKGSTGKNKHASSGVSGQWKNKLPQKVVNVFREKYTQLLIRTGYEQNANW